LGRLVDPHQDHAAQGAAEDIDHRDTEDRRSAVADAHRNSSCGGWVRATEHKPGAPATGRPRAGAWGLCQPRAKSGCRQQLALVLRLAEEAQQRSPGAQTNPVARLQRSLLGDRAVVDERAVGAVVEQREAARVWNDLAAPARYRGILPL